MGLVGTPQANGDVLDCRAGQFPPALNLVNPVAELWRGKWTPPTFMPGNTYRINCSPRASTVLVQYGTGTPQIAAVPARSVGAVSQIMMDPGAWNCYTSIVEVPHSTTAYAGRRVQLTMRGVVGSECALPTYAWYKGCTPLSDGGTISGSRTGTLVIDPVAASDTGVYWGKVGGFFTPDAMLTVACYANCDGSTSTPALDINDFVCFQSRFAAGDSYANCDGSTGSPTLTVNDFVCYQSEFVAGCSAP